MQQHAVDAEHAEAAVVAAVAVAGVADQMVRQVLEMPTDLTKAPGLRLAAQQGVARGGKAGGRDLQLAGGQPLEMGERRLLTGLPGPPSRS